MDIRKFILRKTGLVALGEVLGVGAMIGIFALLGAFSWKVPIGGLVGGVAATANFFVMALSVNRAADKATDQNVQGGKAAIKASYLLRMAVLFLLLFAFAKSGIADPIALVVPLIFPRFTLTLAEFFSGKSGEKQS